MDLKQRLGVGSFNWPRQVQTWKRLHFFPFFWFPFWAFLKALNDQTLKDSHKSRIDGDGDLSTVLPRRIKWTLPSGKSISLEGKTRNIWEKSKMELWRNLDIFQSIFWSIIKNIFSEIFFLSMFSLQHTGLQMVVIGIKNIRQRMLR